MRLIILFILSATFAQAASINFKFGKVSKDEVMQERHSFEPDAKSAILYQEGKTSLQYNQSQSRFEVITEVYKRIKIYDAADSDAGTITIPYYNISWNDEKVHGIKGKVYNTNGTKITQSDLKKNHIFDEKHTKYKRIKKIAMPNVKKGSVIEIKYKKVSPYSSQIPKWYFQYDIPCNKTIYKVETPEWFTYNTSAKGILPVHTETKTQSRNITFRNTYDSSKDPRIVRKKVSYNKIDYSANITTYSAENTPSIKEEDFVPCMNNYRSSISYELLRTRIPGGNVRSYTESWSGISKLFYEHDDIGKQVRKKIKTLGSVLDKTKEMTDDAKAEYLYNYVRDNYAWNGYYGVRADEGMKELIKMKSGNVGDINLLLANLFSKAGISARLVATRARDYGFINLYYPSQIDLNYLLVQYDKEDGSKVLLDATDPQVAFGYLPYRALNMKGVTIQATGGKEIDINNPNITKLRNVVKATLSDDMSLDFNCTSKRTGFSSLEHQYNLSEFNDSDAIMDYKESAFENRSYESFEYTSNKEQNKIEIKEHFVSDDDIENINDKIYINAFMGFFSTEQPYTEETRTLPIFRDELSNNNTSIQLTIPDGYALESLPENISFSLPSDMGRFTFRAVNSGNKIVISINEKQTEDLLLPKDYDALRKYYELIGTKGQEKIVLIKV